jgi:hypothetical protein
VQLLKSTFDYEPNTVWGREVKGLATWYALATARLLDKQIIRVAGEFENGNAPFQFTQLGWHVRQTLQGGVPQFAGQATDPKTDEPQSEEPPQNAT